MDKTAAIIDHRIPLPTAAAESAAAAAAGGKYAVDAAMFDMLVEKASTITVTTNKEEDNSSGGGRRTLRQRYLEQTDADIEYLATQLAQRLDGEGGEAVLEIGGGDDSNNNSSSNDDVGSVSLADMNDTDVAAVVTAVERAAKHPRIGGFARLLVDSGRVDAAGTSDASNGRHARQIGGDKSKQTRRRETSDKQARRMHILVRRNPTGTVGIGEVRVAVVGNVDAGKSTMLGVLTQGRLDDGRGRARVALFRHKHEAESGRTSSVGLEILGFDRETGAPVRTGDARRPLAGSAQTSRKAGADWQAVCARASKLVTFLDLAGHEKYLKTTVFGMASGAPDYVMLMVGANAGLSGMAREHLGLALALGVPVMVVVTKIDMCPAEVLDATLKQLTRVLRSSGCRKVPVAVGDMATVVLAATRFVSQRVCPVFQVSNVTGEGIDNLLAFLNILAPAQIRQRQNSNSNSVSNGNASVPLRYTVNEIFSVPHAGTVVSGVLAAGEVRVGDSVWLGPDFRGIFVPTTIKGIHRKRVEVQSAVAGQSVSLALRKISRQQVRNGMVVAARIDRSTVPPLPIAPPVASRCFEAEVVVLYHSTTITPRYQAMVHCGCVRQTARVLAIARVETATTHSIRGVAVEVRSSGAHAEADSAADTAADSSTIANGHTLLRTGDRARVLFQFVRHPECLDVGSRLIFREGRTKGVGKITRILSSEEEKELQEQPTAKKPHADPAPAPAPASGAKHNN
ncbi:hypothetical protein IWW48_004988 [Coemansia sp. RSA 1200]|nr:hypothetical protein IWW48_004988 [Coemansia sp. RSA 1200]